MRPQDARFGSQIATPYQPISFTPVVSARQRLTVAEARLSVCASSGGRSVGVDVEILAGVVCARVRCAGLLPYRSEITRHGAYRMNMRPRLRCGRPSRAYGSFMSQDECFTQIFGWKRGSEERRAEYLVQDVVEVISERARTGGTAFSSLREEGRLRRHSTSSQIEAALRTAENNKRIHRRGTSRWYPGEEPAR